MLEVRAKDQRTMSFMGGVAKERPEFSGGLVVWVV